MPRVCILDYGSGNVKSVYNALKNITSEVTISNQNDEISCATHLVLPGVGSFNIAMQKIKNSIDVNLVKSKLEDGIPFLGICVGMQVLSSIGRENVIAEGLSILGNSEVVEIKTNLTLPHIGWNNLIDIKNHNLLNGVDGTDNFYFVHSYRLSKIDDNFVIGKTIYGEEFPSVVAKNNIMGVQFHPEKSQKSGIKILRNFLELR